VPNAFGAACAYSDAAGTALKCRREQLASPYKENAPPKQKSVGRGLFGGGSNILSIPLKPYVDAGSALLGLLIEQADMQILIHAPD